MGKLESVETFVAIVQNEGISEAARKLGIAKSAVSRRLQDLEYSLKTQLINRDTRNLSLTNEGAIFYDKSLRLIESFKDAESIFTKQSNTLTGTLRITAPMSFGILNLSPLIADFLTNHDELKLELELNDRKVDLVQEGFDIGIRISGFEDSSLVGRKIAQITHEAVASPDYLSKMGTPKSPKDLVNHRGLVYSNTDLKKYWRFDTSKPNCKFDSSKINCVLKANNGDVLKDAAIAGLGIAVLPSFIVEKAVKEKKLKVILHSYQRPPTLLYMLYQNKKHQPARVKAFVDFILKNFNQSISK